MKDKETEAQAIQRFSKAMHAKMVERRARYKPFGWRDLNYKTVDDLRRHLREEMKEFEMSGDVEDEMSELVDVANCAFMLHDRLRLDNTPKT